MRPENAIESLVTVSQPFQPRPDNSLTVSVLRRTRTLNFGVPHKPASDDLETLSIRANARSFVVGLRKEQTKSRLYFFQSPTVYLQNQHSAIAASTRDESLLPSAEHRIRADERVLTELAHLKASRPQSLLPTCNSAPYRPDVQLPLFSAPAASPLFVNFSLDAGGLRPITLHPVQRPAAGFAYITDQCLFR
ncbi:hypothetical protein AB1N83_010055 [Pleurotus pulmonarius]